MTIDPKLAPLNEHNLFQDISPEEIQEFCDRSGEFVEFEAGALLISEGEIGDALYLLLEGQVEVFKTDPTNQQAFVLAQFGPGKALGDFALFDPECRRSASVRTLTPSVLLKITFARFEAAFPEGASSGARLRRNAARELASRLNSLSDQGVGWLKEQLAHQIRTREFGAVFIYSILITSLSSHIHYSMESDPLTIILSSWGALLLSVLPLVGLVLWMKQPLEAYGLSLAHRRRNLTEGLLVSALLLPTMAIAESLREPGEPLFTWFYFQGWPLKMTLLYFILYPLHSLLQEFIMRGVMQGALSRFMSEAHPALPIMTVSFLFALAHLHKSLTMALLTFAFSLALGALYHRHKSLLGVTIIHAALGTMAQALGYL